jgi:hypothetical protein
MPITAALIGFGGSVIGGAMAGSSAEDAANTRAAAEISAAQIAADESRFRPVGITSRFGSSNFTYGPDGRVSGAGYALSPEALYAQNFFSRLAGGGLMQAEQAQQQFAPLAAGAQGLFGLGQQYLAQSPEQAAQKYMSGQQNLLAPSRERQFAQLQTQLFNTGRGGLAVGATGARPSGAAGLGAASPEMEAYYNAIAQQDAQLAAGAQQAGMDQVRFGAGLLGTGGNLLTQGYQGQTAALGPYEAYLAQMKQLEALGQQPLELGSALGGRIANPQGGQALLTGGMGAAASNYAANAYNPFATALTSASQNPTLMNAAGRYFGGGNTGTFSDYGGMGAAGAASLADYGI